MPFLPTPLSQGWLYERTDCVHINDGASQADQWLVVFQKNILKYLLNIDLGERLQYVGQL